jgi:hypothetical protein
MTVLATMTKLTDRERSIAMAAYLKGLAVGLAIDRTKTWHRQIRRSSLVTSTLFAGIDDFLTDGRGHNPLVIYERNKLAEECGATKPHALACEAVGQLLHAERR